ncbi:MAG TPA: hypothetical protein VIX17_11710 [Pyrinomonadaceae bacterium]|jgi:hypothetical protein
MRLPLKYIPNVDAVTHRSDLKDEGIAGTLVDADGVDIARIWGDHPANGDEAGEQIAQAVNAMLIRRAA